MKKQEYKNPLRDKNGKFRFTKELKENWLKVLKSGEYEQYPDQLRNPNNLKQCCCLGVLADIHPNIRISKDGIRCILGNKKASYDPFNEMKLHNGCEFPLSLINDSSYKNHGIRDYSKVIPLIEQLPTVD